MFKFLHALGHGVRTAVLGMVTALICACGESPSTSPEGDVSGETLAFPQAEGFGRLTLGGLGGPVVDVVNLNNSGPGSLRECAEILSGPRTCRIVAAGTVSLGGVDIIVRHDYLTIDGRGAPMTLKDGGVTVRASHTIIRHLRVRPGPLSWLARGTNASGIVYMSREDGVRTRNHIADHVSVSWCTDDSIAVVDGTQNVTIQDSIISEGLRTAADCTGCEGKGILLGSVPVGGPMESLSVVRTLYAHIFIRFPNAQRGQIDFVNNVAYNGNGTDAQIVPFYGPVFINMVGNYWKDGPSSSTFNNGANLRNNVIRAVGGMAFSTQSGIYVQDNIGRSRPTGAEPETDIIWQDNNGVAVQSVRFPYPQMTTTSALQASQDVLSQSGAQPRDAVDQRVTDDVRHGTGHWISDPAEVGGWPDLAS